ncbi:hypothetical protein U1Q18_046300, partial [Sarracenia purpurea var. burkii]
SKELTKVPENLMHLPSAVVQDSITRGLVVLPVGYALSLAFALCLTLVEAAYDMLLMQSLSQRRAGKVVDSNIRYADVKPLNAPGMGSMPQWLQTTVNNSSVSFEKPDAGDLGIQAGVYGALMYPMLGQMFPG